MKDTYQRPWDLLETVWRIRVPTGLILECGIYRTASGFEARIGYEEKRLASQSSPDLSTVRETAETFRRQTLTHDGYEQLPLTVASIEPFPGGRIVRNGERVMVDTRNRKVVNGDG